MMNLNRADREQCAVLCCAGARLCRLFALRVVVVVARRHLLMLPVAEDLSLEATNTERQMEKLCNQTMISST